MATSSNTMAQPNPDWWIAVFKWIADNSIQFMVFALAWKGIDKVFKYFSEARDAELRRIVHDEMNPTIKDLGEKIQDLSEAIWSIKNK